MIKLQDSKRFSDQWDLIFADFLSNFANSHLHIERKDKKRWIKKETGTSTKIKNLMNGGGLNTE